MKIMKYKTWTLIDWDGNPDLKLKCWRKSFGRGYVSVGIGSFLSIVYSYGPHHDDSMSGTRWREDGPITEEQAMKVVDRAKGLHNHYDNDP